MKKNQRKKVVWVKNGLPALTALEADHFIFGKNNVFYLPGIVNHPKNSLAFPCEDIGKYGICVELFSPWIILKVIAYVPL